MGTLLNEWTELLWRKKIRLHAVSREGDRTDVEVAGQSLVGFRSTFVFGSVLIKHEENRAAGQPDTTALRTNSFCVTQSRRWAPF